MRTDRAPQPHAAPAVGPDAHTHYLAYELRDGILQDLVAVGLLIEVARRSLDDPEATSDAAPAALLARAAEAVQGDIAALRSVIDRLRPAA